MKTSKKNQSITLILAILILFQGCTVYKSTPISLEQVVQNQSKVKVRTINKKKFKFNNIEFEDGKYIGIKKSDYAIVRTSLDQNNIKSINEKDITLSTILSFGIPAIILGLLLLGYAAGL